jgi:hypothetical protein
VISKDTSACCAGNFIEDGGVKLTAINSYFVELCQYANGQVTVLLNVVWRYDADVCNWTASGGMESTALGFFWKMMYKCCC